MDLKEICFGDVNLTEVVENWSSCFVMSGF